MNYLSVCSGIEAATVGWHLLGWQAVAFSEIEPFPCAALAHHYPTVPNFGDMTKFKEWPDACVCRELGHAEQGESGTCSSMEIAGRRNANANQNGGKRINERRSTGGLCGTAKGVCNECGGTIVDVLVGGTPCQSFSVAGLRKGLADPRGNLMLTYLAIAAKYRPRWLVWENVPGVLSSSGGNDFASLLRGLGECGYGFAYRILDAQHFGVPQRRRRVFVVGHFGSWQRAAAVLFERHSLQGHPAPSRAAGKGFTHPVAPSLTSSGRGVERSGDTRGQDPVVALCMSTGQAGAEIGIGIGTTLNCNHEAPIVTHSLRGEGFDASEDGTGRGTPLVPVAIPMHDMVTRHAGTDGSGHQVGKGHGMGIGDNGDPMFTLGSDRHAVAFVHQAGGTQTTLGYDQERGTAPTLSKCQTPAVAWSIMPQNSGKDYKARKVDVLQPLMAGGQTHGNQGGDIIQFAMQVRRLTPRECERLQGFPDNYTQVPYRNKPAADGPRYKALGNSMAVPVMAWIGKRIQQVESI